MYVVLDSKCTTTASTTYICHTCDSWQTQSSVNHMELITAVAVFIVQFYAKHIVSKLRVFSCWRSNYYQYVQSVISHVITMILVVRRLVITGCYTLPLCLTWYQAVAAARATNQEVHTAAQLVLSDMLVNPATKPWHESLMSRQWHRPVTLR